MPLEYEGPERRRDYLQLDAALDEVDKLHGAVNSLATAVVNTAPRAELEAIREEVRRDFIYKLYVMGGLSLIIVLIMVLFINLKTNNLSRSISHGHAVLACMQGKSELQRTGENYQTALATCDATVTR